MTEAQLYDIKNRVKGNPRLEEHGRLLYIHDLLGDNIEWSILTYNLQILGEMIKENIELRKKYENLLHGSKPLASNPLAGGGMPLFPGMNLGSISVCPPGWPTNLPGFSTGSNVNQAAPFPFPGMGSAACTNFPNFSPNMNPPLFATMMNQMFRTKA